MALDLVPEREISPKPMLEVQFDLSSAISAETTNKPRTVEWYRANGQVVRESNEAIRTLPIDPRAGVDPERQQQLDLMATALLANHDHNGIDFRDLGDILNTIAKRTDLTELEKANVWDRAVDGVDQHQVEWRRDGANPFALNINRTWRIASSCKP